jgi:hypothetical protein
MCRKSYKNHLRSNNYEVCTAVAHCFPNILDAIVLENINLSEDKIGWTVLQCNETELDFCHQLLTYGVSSVYFNHKLISDVHWTYKCLKWHDLPLRPFLVFSLFCVSSNLWNLPTGACLPDCWNSKKYLKIWFS